MRHQGLIFWPWSIRVIAAAALRLGRNKLSSTGKRGRPSVCHKPAKLPARYKFLPQCAGQSSPTTFGQGRALVTGLPSFKSSPWRHKMWPWSKNRHQELPLGARLEWNQLTPHISTPSCQGPGCKGPEREAVLQHSFSQSSYNPSQATYLGLTCASLQC